MFSHLYILNLPQEICKVMVKVKLSVVQYVVWFLAYGGVDVLKLCHNGIDPLNVAVLQH